MRNSFKFSGPAAKVFLNDAESVSVLFQHAIPVGIAPTGEVGVDGALTLGTALNDTYDDGIWLYFPEGAVYEESPAGFYWVVMSDTTEGVVYRNRHAPGVDSSRAPRSPAVATSPLAPTVPGDYSGTAEDVELISAAPSGEVGENGALTLDTPFDAVYDDGIWLYFPAGAVYTDSLAGFYWTVMSTEDDGTVYDENPGAGATGFAAPGTPTAIVDAGPGAYTGTTAEVVSISPAPTGNVGADGALTLDTGLAAVHDDGIWLYFPAEALYAESAAGFYWTVMSAEDEGVVFDDNPGAGATGYNAPAEPTGIESPIDPVPMGAYTGVTEAVTVFSGRVPRELLGPHGVLDVSVSIACNSSSDDKTWEIGCGDEVIGGAVETTETVVLARSLVQNRGSEAKQLVEQSVLRAASSSAALAYTAIPTSTNNNLTVDLTLGGDADFAILANLRATILPAH